MDSKFLVRTFMESDYPEVLQLWLETKLTNPERGDTLQTILNTLEFEGAFFILEYTPTHQVIGTSWITNDGRRLYLHHFGIKPGFQGQKLSHLLMNTSLEFAKKLNLQLKLEVHEQNKIAINLYQKVRFSYLGDYKLYIIRNYDNI